MTPFGLPDKTEIGNTLAAVYRVLEILRRNAENEILRNATDADMLVLKNAVEKLGVSVE